jgi:hypothetical protein
MKLLLGLSASCAAALALSAAVHAQALPKGPYLDSCSAAKADGHNLMAQCRNGTGIEHRALLINFPRCVGPITNNNGILTCDFGLGVD